MLVIKGAAWGLGAQQGVKPITDIFSIRSLGFDLASGENL
jgi:hypothetical protein